MGVIAHFRDDITFLRCVGRALLKVTPIARHKTRTFPDLAEGLARRYGDRVALLSDREQLTYREYNARANRYARWALANGVSKGDTVCLLMPNRPEYLAIWLGITRVGGVVALLNTNLTGSALAHCINIVSPKHVIVAAELAEIFRGAEPRLDGEPIVWHHGETALAERRIDREIMGLDEGPLAASERPVLTHDDRCLYIFTSGTTGLPKAANINHYRVLAAMVAYAAVTNATEKDRMYDCLPLYHTSGGVIAFGALTVGGSVFIRERFSARQFWDDVVANDCTLFQYIGELCRYLLNAPPHPKETQHRLRLCCGNGLRPDIWLEFKNRFRIPRIVEFYAATEGNAVLFNFDGMPGAVGRIPPFARGIFPVRVIRFDIAREEPVRGKDGLCIECAPDEVGELVSRIVVDPLKPAQRFDGYADRGATEKKILRDAFEPGDMWFRTGDLMRADARGYFFFVDRIGDTFRWKGENVSTSEVAETINAFPGVKEATVYGVRITGADGRAGMAAIVADEGFDLDGLRRHLDERLSPYARPLFFRMQKTIDATSTFKQRKLDLVADGFDPDRTTDPIYFDEQGAERLARLDPALYRRIETGAVRL